MSATTSEHRNVLLIAPTAFYSFAQVVAGGMEQKGYMVTIANDEYPNNSIGKVLGKLRITLLLSMITRRVLVTRFLDNQEYELVLIIKGRGISPALIEQLKRHAPRIIAYNFDSFQYNPAPLSWFRLVHRYCTFDFADAERYGLPRVDLFAATVTGAILPHKRYEISALMRNHSDRLKYLDRVLSVFPTSRRFVYIYEHNVFSAVLNILKNPLLYWKYRKEIHFTSLPYADYFDVLRTSELTVDYAHPKQSGITIRCFEAASAGTRIITNNIFTLRHPYFDDENTLVFGIDEDPVKLADRLDRIHRVPSGVRNRLIGDFIDDLLKTEIQVIHQVHAEENQ